MPRHRKLTPELGRKILQFVRAGNFPLTAARACGVGETTWYDWLRLGRAGEDEQYVAFVEELDEAEHACKSAMVAILRGAASQDWRAAAWFLERKWPEEWGRRDQLVHEVSGHIPRLTKEERSRLEEAGRRAEVRRLEREDPSTS